MEDYIKEVGENNRLLKLSQDKLLSNAKNRL
jgi:hypothetical protein